VGDRDQYDLMDAPELRARIRKTNAALAHLQKIHDSTNAFARRKALEEALSIVQREKDSGRHPDKVARVIHELRALAAREVGRGRVENAHPHGRAPARTVQGVVGSSEVPK